MAIWAWAGLVSVGSGSLRAADSASASSLKELLPRLGYTGVNFKWEERGGNPLIRAKVGGRSQVLLVDTGWSRTTLDEKAARGLKTLGELGVTLHDTFSGRITDSSVVVIPELVLGAAEFLNQPAYVKQLDMDYVRLPFDGALGCDFQLRNFGLMDCGSARLYLRGEKLSTAGEQLFMEALRRGGWVEVPLEIYPKYLCPVVEAQVEGQTVRLLVDTGADFCLLDDGLASQLRLELLKRDRPKTGSRIRARQQGAIVGVNEIGAHDLFGAQLKSLRLGAREWTGFDVGVANLKAWGLSESGRPGGDIQGLVGAELLIPSGALIDFSARRLWLLPGK